MRKYLATTLTLLLLLVSGFVPIDNTQENMIPETSEVTSLQVDLEIPAIIIEEIPDVFTEFQHNITTEEDTPLVTNNFVSPGVKVPDIELQELRAIQYRNSLPPTAYKHSVIPRGNFQRTQLLLC